MLFHCLDEPARFEPMPPSSWVPERSFINLDPLFPNQSDQSILDELSVAWLPIVELKNFICCISNGLKRVSKWPIVHQKTKLPHNVFFSSGPSLKSIISALYCCSYSSLLLPPIVKLRLVFPHISEYANTKQFLFSRSWWKKQESNPGPLRRNTTLPTTWQPTQPVSARS